MTEELEGCDLEDVICQLETLKHLRGLQHEMGKEQFQARFPELSGLGNRISNEIVKSEESFDAAVERCRLSREEAQTADPAPADFHFNTPEVEEEGGE